MPLAQAELAGWRVDLAEFRVQALLETGQPERAIGCLEPLLAEQPFRERLWCQRMLGLYRAGRQAAALETFGRVRTLLAQEMGVDPGIELRELHRRILDQDPDLDHHPGQSSLLTREVHLPVRRADLIGRTADVTALIALLDRTAVVTLTGPGGTGKTRLAVEVAYSVRETFAGGVHFVDLSTLQDPQLVPLLVAQLLALNVPVNFSLLDTLLEFCSGRPLLLVLDNCENVLVGAAELVSRLSSECPSLRVLATSREPLEVPGEKRWPVAPLSLPDPDTTGLAGSPAVDLFVARTYDSRPDLDLSGSDGENISRICAAVAGLPLGIELAAAHARFFELAEIAATLSRDPIRMVRLGAGPSRQATLLDTVEWSYRLLGAAEQILHRRLSCVAGAVTLEAAAALCRVPPLDGDQAMELLAGLVHRSLLVSTRPAAPNRPTTFSQLVPIRAHAHSSLTDPMERAAVEISRNDWVLEHVRSSAHDGRSGQVQFYDWLDDNQASVRSTLNSMLINNPDVRGLELTATLCQYWFDRNRLIEGGRWARAAAELAAVMRLDELDTAIGRALLGCMLALGPDPGAARQILVDTIDLLRDPPPLKVALVGQVLILMSLSAFLGLHWDLGLRAADAALTLGRATGESHLLLRGRALRAANALQVLGADVAVAEADAVLAAVQTVPNANAELNAAVTRGAAARMSGDGAAGVYWTSRAVAANRSAGAVNMADLGELLAANLLLAGRAEEALRCFAACAAVHARSGLSASRRVATAPSLAELKSLIPPAMFDRIWASGQRMGSADPEQFINEWL